MKRAITITVRYPCFRRWDIVRLYGDKTVMVVRVGRLDESNNTAKITTYPYRESKSKVISFLKLKLFKLIVRLKII